MKATITYPIYLYWTKLAQKTLTHSHKLSLTGKESECYLDEPDAEIEISHWLEDGEFTFRVNSFTTDKGFEYSPNCLAPGVREIFAEVKELLEADNKFGAAVWAEVEAEYQNLGVDADGAPRGLVEAA